MTNTAKSTLSLPSWLGGQRPCLLGFRVWGFSMSMSEALPAADRQALANFLQFFFLHIGPLSCSISLTLFYVVVCQNLSVQQCK